MMKRNLEECATRRPGLTSVSVLAGWVICLLVFATETRAEPTKVEPTKAEPRPAESRWMPSASIGFDIHSQDLDASTSANWLPILDTESGQLRNLFFDGQVGVFAPSFYEGGLAPRVFAYAGGQVPFTDIFDAQRSAWARDGPRTIPIGCGGTTTGGIAELASCSLTSTNQVTVDGFWYAGIGVDLSLPIRNRSFHLRPSIGYFGQRWEGAGHIESVKTLTAGRGRTVEFVDASSGPQTAHGIGPALELGIEVARIGPVGIDFYLETRFAWMLWGKRSVNFSNDQGTCVQEPLSTPPSFPPCSTQSPPPTELSGIFETTLGRFVAQGGAGLRFTWTGALIGGP